MLDLLAPDGVDHGPLEQAARPRAAGMASNTRQRTSPAVAALDAVLALVATGDPALNRAHRQPDVSAATLAQSWPEANALLAALLADCLAEVAVVLVERFGPGTIGSLVPPELAHLGRGPVFGREARHLRATLASGLLDHAAFYLGWQQHRTCQCRPGECTPTKLPTHHLHAWRPGPSREAADLSTWFRTWAGGSRRRGELTRGAYDESVFYRHAAWTLPGTSIDVLVGEVLSEVCVVPTCDKFGTLAHRVTTRDAADAAKRTTRICPADQDHDLDFARKRRSREMLFVGQDASSHRLYDHLAWEASRQRWFFGSRQGNARWVPQPPGPAFQHLRSRSPSVEAACMPTVPYVRRECPSDWGPRPEPETAVPLDEQLLAQLAALIEEAVHASVPSGEPLLGVVAALRPTGAIDLYQWCQVCACAAPAEGARDYCESALEQAVQWWAEHRPVEGRGGD
ncbi:MAG: hypothetical protein ACRDZ8_08355 [Acidimicrobiales bacterium]